MFAAGRRQSGGGGPPAPHVQEAKITLPIMCLVIAHLFCVLWYYSGYPQHTMIFSIPCFPSVFISFLFRRHRADSSLIQ